MKKEKNLKPVYKTTVAVLVGNSWYATPIKSISLISSVDITKDGERTNRNCSAEIVLKSPYLQFSDVPSITKIRRKIENEKTGNFVEVDLAVEKVLSLGCDGYELVLQLPADTNIGFDYSSLGEKDVCSNSS